MITGASSDIGIALIRKIYHDYDHIWAHYNRSSDRLIQLRDEGMGRLVPIKANFADSASIKVMTKTILDSGFPPDHIVHFSATGAKNKPFLKWNTNDYSSEFLIEVNSIIDVLDDLLPYMVKREYGKIVFMLSSLVAGVSPKYQSPYIVSKFALLGLMKNLAAEFTEKGITVNGVSPDMVETKFNDKVARKIKEINAEKSPLKRNLNVDDVVPAIAFLLSDSADAISGTNLTITAGMDII